MVKVLLICFIIITCSQSNATQATRPSGCPVRPTSDLRGPPGIPGKKGELGDGRFRLPL